MKNGRNRDGFYLYIIFSISGALLLLMPVFALSDEIYQRDVEMAWEAVDQATGYDVEVTRIKENGDRILPAVYSVGTPAWKARLRIGLYELRIRSRDDRNVPGDWSEPLDITVNFTALTPKTPIGGVILSSQNTDKDLIPFQWQSVPEAESYLIHVMNSQGVTLTSQRVKEPEAELELPVGEKLLWWVQATSQRLGPGALPEKPFAFSVKGGALEAARSLDLLRDEHKILKWTWKADAREKSSRTRIDQWVEKQTFLRWDQVDSSNPGEALASKSINEGIYRMRLQSRHPLMTPSPVTTVFFRVDQQGKIFQGETLEDVKNQPLRLHGWSAEMYAVLRSSSLEGTYPDLETNLKSEDNTGYGAEVVVRRTSKSRQWAQSLEVMRSQMAGQADNGSYELIHETLRAMNEWSFLRNQDLSSEFRLRTGLGAIFSTELYPNTFNTGVNTRDYSLLEWVLALQWASRWSDHWNYSVMLQLESLLVDIEVPSGFEEFHGGHLQLAAEYKFSRKTHFIMRLNGRGHTLVYKSEGARRESNLGSVHLDLGVRWNF